MQEIIAIPPAGFEPAFSWVKVVRNLRNESGHYQEVYPQSEGHHRALKLSEFAHGFAGFRQENALCCLYVRSGRCHVDDREVGPESGAA